MGYSARAISVLTLALACALGCSSSEESSSVDAGTGTGGTGGTGSTGGAAGSGGIQLTDGGPAGTCSWTQKNGDAGSGGDYACDTLGQLDPACPGEQPAAGEACTGTTICRYPVGLGYAQLHCASGAWVEEHHECTESCESLDATAGVPVPGTCGSEDVSCGAEQAGNLVTDLEQLQKALKDIAGCCGMVSEVLFTVSFSDGCATAIDAGSWTNPDAIECLAKSLSGKRINCALKHSCATVSVSTVADP